MANAVVNIPDHISGDTFDGIIYRLTSESVALDLTGYTFSLRARLVNSTNVNDVRTLTLVAENLIDGKVKIASQIISWPAGQYNYEITMTKPDNSVKTVIKGNWTILKKI